MCYQDVKTRLKPQASWSTTAFVIAALCFSFSVGCGNKNQIPSAEASSVKQPEAQNKETRSGEGKSVEPQVQSEIGRMEAERRASLLSEAQAALDETRNAIAALDKGDKKAALDALARASGKLDVLVARDPSLALAPVGVLTTLYDLYARPEAVRAAVRQAKDDLSGNRVQQARGLLQGLASQAEIHVTEVPLATYPAAIKAVTPLIEAGQTQQAKAALYAALNTLVIQTYVIPLPKVRAQAMLKEAQQLAAKTNRTEDENKRLRGLIDSARTEIQLAEALGYGTKDNYKPIYAQLDDLQKKAEGGQSGKSVLDKLQDSLKNFKFIS